ncbi:OLC1v1030024C1 [Oldenlandia corymbosa var. corymbosa]|uniref:OLC1v1030024C1 n=1 Tax=Oldenlandia corymbosa var. corymbosa TaxID=529605 RepID=A0AAV1CIH2_OLDCO|nr:OLC1v1030024C1 [Oldenlandia corymbosa var. corymbosa]
MTDAFDDEAEPTISIGDYLQGVEEQELEADLVLGGDEGKECTYGKGYMKRQAIFSCLTCTPDGNAGVCTACSLSCHDGHEIVELWTKRKFRCDCGNSKFGEAYCKLLPNKDVENVENSYNHNFKGLYCTCNRPYPDPDAEEQEEMIQCCICEDWFHEEHLGLEPSDEIPRDEEGEPLYEDLICQSCSNMCFFLTLYPQTFRVKQQKVLTSSQDKGAENADSCSEQQNGNCIFEASAGDTMPRDVSLGKGILVEETKASNIVLQDGNSNAGPSKACVLDENLLESELKPEKSEAMFLCKNWREALCRCQKCLEFYTQKGISFLVDKEDSIAEYEKMAKQKRDEKLQEQQGQELNFLNKLGHVEKMEFLTGIADMKSELHSFLESFDASKPITADDVHQVFENLAKKRKRNP